MAQTRKAEETKQKQETGQTQSQTGERQSTDISAGQSRGQTRSGQGLTTSGTGQGRGLSRRDPFMSPFSFMRRFSEEMDRLFEDFGFPGGGLSLGLGRDFGRGFQQMSNWSPQIEFFERGNELVVRADLPGMSRDDVNVDVEDDQIIIRGERRDERESNEQGFYHSERSYGSFYRAVPLPPGVESEQVKAAFSDGVLEITLPKPEQKSRSRRIEIGDRSPNR